MQEIRLPFFANRVSNSSCCTRHWRCVGYLMGVHASRTHWQPCAENNKYLSEMDQRQTQRQAVLVGMRRIGKLQLPTLLRVVRLSTHLSVLPTTAEVFTLYYTAAVGRHVSRQARLLVLLRGGAGRTGCCQSRGAPQLKAQKLRQITLQLPPLRSRCLQRPRGVRCRCPPWKQPRGVAAYCISCLTKFYFNQLVCV